jgi:hypothetical protein
MIWHSMASSDRLKIDGLLDVASRETIHHRRFDVARENRVHADVRLGVVQCGGLGQADDCVF